MSTPERALLPMSFSPRAGELTQGLVDARQMLWPSVRSLSLPNPFPPAATCPLWGLIPRPISWVLIDAWNAPILPEVLMINSRRCLSDIICIWSPSRQLKTHAFSETITMKGISGLPGQFSDHSLAVQHSRAFSNSWASTATFWKFVCPAAAVHLEQN